MRCGLIGSLLLLYLAPHSFAGENFCSSTNAIKQEVYSPKDQALGVPIIGYLVTGLGDAVRTLRHQVWQTRIQVPSLASVNAIRSLEESTAVLAMSVTAISAAISKISKECPRSC